MVDFDDPDEWRRFQAECEEALEELDQLVEQRKVYTEALGFVWGRSPACHCWILGFRSIVHC